MLERLYEYWIVLYIFGGTENQSHIYSRKQVNDMVNSHKDWEFVFIGANQDAILKGTQHGVTKESSITYKQGNEASVYKCLSNGISRFRTNESQCVNFTQEEREEACPTQNN